MELYRESESDGQKGNGRGESQTDISLRAGVDTVFGDFDFGNSTEGKEQLYEVPGRLFRCLFYNMSHSVGDRCLEHYALGMQTSQIDSHELPWLQHQSPGRILPP
jgi:hypothetical protein